MRTRAVIRIAGACFALAAAGARAQVVRDTDRDADIDAAGRAQAQIEVAEGREPARGLSDAEVGVRVQAALTREIEASGVQAQVKNGVATLRGSVANEDVKRRAERIARDVEGVTRVHNELVVEPATPVAQRVEERDAEGPPAEAIEARLRGDERLADRDIDVHTKGTVVTLTGEVNSNDEREAAGRVAAEAAEGFEVRNRLEVATTRVAPSER